MLIINNYWVYRDRPEQNKRELFEDMMFIKGYFDTILELYDTPIDEIIQEKEM